MKAMILAAGVGKRLQHLTKNKPKALVELNGKPLILHCIEKLKTTGVSQVIVNVHHHADMLETYLKSRDFGVEIAISDERDQLLDTGGGLEKAAWFLEGSEAFYVVNTDVITNIDLHLLRTHHLASGALATLAVRNRNTSRYFLFDGTHTLCGWENIKTGESILSRPVSGTLAMAFSGIQIVSPQVFSVIHKKDSFSLTRLWLELSSLHIIKAYVHDHDYWFDTGTPETLAGAASYLQASGTA